ncbi:MAG: carboxypeptidase-like regulatory domain-containing protein [Caldilineaceae bacterium]
MAVNRTDRTGIDITIYPGGEFHGQVTDETNMPLANVEVSAYTSSGSSAATLRGLSGLDGRYVITGLAAGSYYLEFSDLSQIHETTFYGGADVYYRSVRIPVSAHGRVDDLNATMVRGSTISGRVTGSDGVPLADVVVRPTAALASPAARQPPMPTATILWVGWIRGFIGLDLVIPVAVMPPAPTAIWSRRMASKWESR